MYDILYQYRRGNVTIHLFKATMIRQEKLMYKVQALAETNHEIEYISWIWLNYDDVHSSKR
jgi:hypothetical protein